MIDEHDIDAVKYEQCFTVERLEGNAESEMLAPRNVGSMKRQIDEKTPKFFPILKLARTHQKSFFFFK